MSRGLLLIVGELVRENHVFQLVAGLSLGPLLLLGLAAAFDSFLVSWIPFHEKSKILYHNYQTGLYLIFKQNFCSIS